MNVLGYSDNHLSTFFSASIRSVHVFCPTVSTSAFPSALGVEDLKIEKDFGRLMRWRMATNVSCSCSWTLTIGPGGLTFHHGVALYVPDALQFGPDEEGSDRVEELDRFRGWVDGVGTTLGLTV